MKQIVLLISFVVAVALCASAQTYINFHEMPTAWNPSLMPDNYYGMTWDNLYYVTPGIWSGEGAGFWVDPTTQHNIVAFTGGPLCNLPAACYGSIKLLVAPNATATFTPMTMQVSAGWVTNNVIVTAYNNSEFVGRLLWRLTTTPQTFSFPATWNVTQLVFTPDVGTSHSVYPTDGSMVMYNFYFLLH